MNYPIHICYNYSFLTLLKNSINLTNIYWIVTIFMTLLKIYKLQLMIMVCNFIWSQCHKTISSYKVNKNHDYMLPHLKKINCTCRWNICGATFLQWCAAFPQSQLAILKAGSVHDLCRASSNEVGQWLFEPQAFSWFQNRRLGLVGNLLLFRY